MTSSDRKANSIWTWRMWRPRVLSTQAEDFQLFAGFRYISMDLELNFDPQIPLPPQIPTQVNGDQSWTDLMLGGRVKKDLGERWRFWGRADLAGFGLTDGSDLTWNLVLMGQVKVARTYRPTLWLPLARHRLREQGRRLRPRRAAGRTDTGDQLQFLLRSERSSRTKEANR